MDVRGKHNIHIRDRQEEPVKLENGEGDGPRALENTLAQGGKNFEEERLNSISSNSHWI